MKIVSAGTSVCLGAGTMFAWSNEILEAHEINNPPFLYTLYLLPSWPELLYVNKAFYGSTCPLGRKVVLSRLLTCEPSP